MTKEPLYVAFVWHMHQPFYKDIVTGEYVMPWVRLHAIKDYYDLVAILDNFKGIKQTFNLVPSLLEQIEEYVKGDAMDKHLAITMKDPGQLSNEDKIFMLQNFFMANWETMVFPHKRYHELLLKRGRYVSLEEIKSVAHRFTESELLDLQVWFNLTWFGYIYQTKDPVIKGLIGKGRNFTLEDKKALMEKQKEIIGKVIPKYRELYERGQIELSFTPYYHPILPLLIDTSSSKEALPSIKLPEHRFRHPEDAKYQINEGMKYFSSLFGKPPCGMWPSEGSVSEDIIPLVCDAGIKWIATDEEILSMSLGRDCSGVKSLSSSELFKPYLLKRGGNALNIIFRDHNLSDLIGFVYAKWDPCTAASDFVMHLNNIRASLPDDGKKYLVSVILDGENAWEYYRNNGWDFLSELYKQISHEPGIKTTRVCDFLSECPPTDNLPHLFSGSWINHNFRIWIGHDEDNKAWEHLSKARLALENLQSRDEKAWKELYIAEGSDWFWWYGDEHSSENDEIFDMLFRKHLKNIYHLINKAVPQYLDVPIKQIRAAKPTREPVSLVKPQLDGMVTNYYEWLSAGYYDIAKLKGAMHQAETVVKGIYYGFDIDNVNIRIDTSLDLKNSECKHFSFGLTFFHPNEYKVKTLHDDASGKCLLNIYKLENDAWIFVKAIDTVAIKDVFEASIPFKEIGVRAGDGVQFVVIIEKDTQELERWPRGGSISFIAPGSDYEEKQWTI